MKAKAILAEIISYSSDFDFLKARLPLMNEDEAITSIHLISKAKEGRKAIKAFLKALPKEEKKKMAKLIFGAIAPFDLLNHALERICELVYLLP